MDEMVFLGTLIVLVVAALLLARSIINKQTGRQPNHPIYREVAGKKPSHRPASHTLMHSHSTNRIHVADGMWRTSRLKSNESHWESGVVAANRILTDSELALEDREPEQGHGMSSVEYRPANSSRATPKSANGRRSRR